MDIGLRIKRSREAAGMEQEDLAQKAGISQPYLSRIESGRKQASDDTLIAISESLGGAPEVLLTACAACRINATLRERLGMDDDNTIAVQQIIQIQQQFTEDLQKLYDNRPQDEQSPEYLDYLSNIKTLLQKISISSDAFRRVIGERPEAV